MDRLTLEEKLKDYTHQGIGRIWNINGLEPYEVLMISNQVHNQLEIAKQLSIRTLFAVQNARINDFEAKTHFKPDLDFISFTQLESCIQLLSSDIPAFKHLKNEDAELLTDEILKLLPSNKLINVGIVYKHHKNPISKFCANGFAIHSHQVKYTFLNIEVDIETQGPFDIILHKTQDYYGELYGDNKEGYLQSLVQYCESNSVILLDSPSVISPLL